MSVKYYARNKVHDNDIIVAAGDVETDGLGGELLMIQFGIFSEVYVLTGPDMVSRFFDAIRQFPKPVIWYFHFGQYDWRYFLDYLAANKLEVDVRLRSATDIYEINILFPGEKTPVVLRDSYAIWPETLEDLAKNFCPELPKLDIDIANFDPLNADHIQYARRDIEILLTGLPRLFDYLAELFDVSPGATLAGTAIRAWMKTLDGEQIYNGQEYNEQEEYIRRAYYGGIVFLTDTKPIKKCETFDLNSSYPGSMRDHGVPYGRIIETDDFKSDKLGIYRCRVRAPDNVRVPILPGRNERGAMRWYAGEFDTQVTSSELVFAAQHGYEIIEIYDGIYFEEHIFPFADFISKCKLFRDTYKGTAREMVAKRLQNSSYGRFGSRRTHSRLFSAWSDEDLIGAMPFDESGHWYVREEFDEELLCLPQWAAFITAHSRLRLLKAVYDIGPENCIYGDTDSITVRAGMGSGLDVGKDYGQWKLEKEWKVFRAIAPKVYSGILINGKFQGAAKGLPSKYIKDSHWSELLESGETAVSGPSLSSLRVAFKKGVTPAEEKPRKSSDLKKSANFAIAKNGTVRLKFAHEK
jgi:hypothetical protein